MKDLFGWAGEGELPVLPPEGFSQLAGKPKVGKSWLALAMALEDSPLRLQERHGQQIGRWHVAGAVFRAPRVEE